MSPKQLGVELGGPRKDDPRRERSNPPISEATAETRSVKGEVATFRTSSFQMGVPAAVLVALISGVSAFAIAWAQKPAAVALSPEQARQLQVCSEELPRMRQELAEVKATIRWIEPQVGVLMARTQLYVPPPPAPAQPSLVDAMRAGSK